MRNSVFSPAIRLSGVKASPILALSQKAKDLRAQGRSIIDLTVGEPDFDTPPHIKEAAVRAMDAGKTKYTALAGDPDLVDALIERFQFTYGLKAERGNVIVTNGAKQAIYNAFAATVNPGDEVILLAPYWTSYADMARLEGAVVKSVSGRWSMTNGWSLDLAAIEAAISPRTRWILLNSPCNPSGSVFSKKDLDGLCDVLQRHQHVWLLSDDIYQDIAWPAPAPLFAAIHPELGDRTMVVGGVSKAYAMTGWRIGWGVGPSALIKAMTSVQSQTTSAPSSISQAAAVAALRGPQGSVEEMAAEFHARRDLVVARLNEMPGFECASPEGAFYAFPRIEDALGNLGFSSDTELCDYLLEAGVAVVPGSAFGSPGFLRLSFAAAIDSLSEACERITRATTSMVEQPMRNADTNMTPADNGRADRESIGER